MAANMAAPLGAVLAHITNRFNRVDIVNLRDPVQAVLRRNQFLKAHRFSDDEEHDGTTMPFKRLHLSEGGEFTDYIDQQFHRPWIPEMSEADSRSFQKNLFEVFSNSVIHSESEIGVFVCGQYFPNEKRLDFTIADGDIGIRGSVRRFFGDDRIGSVSALKWALEKNRTTRKEKKPGGLGLAQLRHFASLDRGRVQIASRFAFCQFHHGHPCFQRVDMDFPGTAVTIEIRTDDQEKYAVQNELIGNADEAK